VSTVIRTDPRESERLRRSAAASEQGPTDEGRDLYGRLHDRLNAYVDAQDPTNVSFPFLRRMRRDHGVSMGMHYIVMPHVKSSFYFEADDARAAAFADGIVRPIYGSTILTIMRFLWAGFSPAVKNFQVINPSWSYVVDGVKRPVWDSSAVGALVYKKPIPLRPESCRLSYDSSGHWNGIEWDDHYRGKGGFTLNGVRKPQIDLTHSLWAVHDEESEDGNPYGFPRIAHCAPIFHMYRYIWTLLARAFENSADPGPVVDFPEEEGQVPDGEERNVDTALRVGRSARSGSTLAIPSAPYQNFAGDRTISLRKWGISYPKRETNFDAIQSFLGYLEAMKFRAMWIPEQASTEGHGGSSSRNVVENLSSQRDTSQIVLMQQIMDNVFMEQLVKPAMAINMPWYEGRLEMKSLGFGQDDEDMVRQVFQLAGQQDLKQFGIDWRRLADSRGFPMRDLDEFLKEQQQREQQAAQIADTSQGPAVEPTQGQRAFRTQTGFTDNYGNPELAYVQLHDPIDMRSRADGDFVASLPRDGVWSSRDAIDAARIVRAAAQDFLERSSRDIALLLSKHERASSEDLDETARTEVADRWLPRRDRVDDLLTATRRSLKRARPRAEDVWLDSQSSMVLSELADAVRYDVSTTTPSSAYTIASRVAREAVEGARAMASVDDVRSSGARLAQLDDGEIVAAELLDGSRPARALHAAPQDLEVRRTVLDDEHLARYDEQAGVVLLSPDLEPEQERQYLLALGDRMTTLTP
jgi:hypothetical protein